MNIVIIVLGSLFTVLSASILSYISIATMVGPWIAPTLVLAGSIILKNVTSRKGSTSFIEHLLLAQAIGAGGGAIAVGIGFSLPLLYFLDQHTFSEFLRETNIFFGVMTGGCIAAGSLGITLGRYLHTPFIKERDLPFPVSQLTYKLATAPNDNRQTIKLSFGIISTLLISILRDGIFTFKGVLPRNITLFKPLAGNFFTFSVWPMLWAIGFTIGIEATLPLLIGIASKYLVLTPINMHSTFLPFSLFPPLKPAQFMTAFCSGMVLSELLINLLNKPYRRLKLFFSYLQAIPSNLKNAVQHIRTSHHHTTEHNDRWSQLSYILCLIEPLIAIGSSVILFTYLEFSFPQQFLLLSFTILATYEICHIGGKIGLIQFGRFSIFVLIPMMVLFNMNFRQITTVCVFFNVCAAMASDTLFDIKTGLLGSLKQSHIHIAQWIGLLITACTIGFILQTLFSHFTLGSNELFGHRGQTKAMLIQSLNLDPYIVTAGLLYGIVLKRFKISATMTLGGMIMPHHLTFGLVIGGIASHLVHDKDSYLPFCSGILATEPLWVLFSVLLK